MTKTKTLDDLKAGDVLIENFTSTASVPTCLLVRKAGPKEVLLSNEAQDGHDSYYSDTRKHKKSELCAFLGGGGYLVADRATAALYRRARQAAFLAARGDAGPDFVWTHAYGVYAKAMLGLATALTGNDQD